MQIKFYKALKLPAILEPNSFYYIANGDEYAEAYLTDSDGVALLVGNSAMINDHILSNMEKTHPMRVVNTVVDRDTITNIATVSMMILVIDATGDPTVSGGSALYAFDHATKIIHKVSEYDNLDLTLDWENITGRPGSQVTDIDDAVASRHVHHNMDVLDKWSEIDGAPLYDGEAIEPIWETSNW